MKRSLIIDQFEIDDDSDCYVIAEIGSNHQGSVETAKELFRTAKECGANAVKLQKRDNKSLFTPEISKQLYDNRNSFGTTYLEHREYLEFGMDEFEELKAFAEAIGITFFSTAFDIPSADFLEKLDMPAYKVASGDITNIPLLRHIAGFGKPMIISTGGANMGDVERACQTVAAINPRVAILQCTSGYPVKFYEMNLKVIQAFRDYFPDFVIGLSAHDNGIAMAVVGYVLGARIIEKHFTLDRAMRGTDHAFSLERSGLSRLVRDLRRARLALGNGRKRAYESEAKPLFKMGKKLVASHNLPAQHKLTEKDISIKSPDNGLPPYEFDNVVGRTTMRAIEKDENITFEDLS